MKRLILIVFILSFACFSYAKSFEEYQQIYNNQKTSIDSDYKQNVDLLGRQYLASLNSQIETAKKSGDLDGYKRLNVAKETFNKSGKLPDSYTADLKAVEVKRDKAVITLSQKYAVALRKLKAQFMQKGDMAGAEAVDKEEKRVKFNAAVKSQELPSTKSANLMRGLVLHYDFDKNTGSTVKDLSGSGNDGKVNGAKWKPFSGGRKGVMEFGVQDEYVGLGNEASLNMGKNDVSISMWLRTTDRAAGIYMLGKYTMGSFPAYGVGTDARHSRLYAFLSDGSVKGKRRFLDCMGATPINDGQWRNVLVVYDRDKDMILYMNSAKEGHAAISQWQGNVENNVPFMLGRIASGSCFNGQLDDVMIWTRALSSSEVKQVYKMTGGK